MFMNKYNILLITKDTTIIEYINETFNDCSIDIYSKEIKLANKYDIIIIDDYKEYNSIKDSLKTDMIINISGVESEKNNFINIKNIIPPFKLNDLLTLIKKTLINLSRTLNFKTFKIIDNTIYCKDQQEILGNKELQLIQYLYKNSANKEELLYNIWRYNSDTETKVFENTINKIRQKFKNIGINDFILFDSGIYRINPIYIHF